MSLKHLHNPVKTIGGKVALWYSVIFITSSLLLFLFTYYFLSTTLKDRDHDNIDFELRQMESIYEISGMDAVKDFITKKNLSRKSKQFFIRIADASNRTIWIFSPEQWRDFDLGELERAVPDGEKGRVEIEDVDYRYVLTVRSAKLPGGDLVQIGMSSEEREDVLRRFRGIFIIVLIPLFILGLGGGLFLSHRTLQPIRNLIRNIRSIDRDEMTAKVPRSMNKDELDELAGLFNEMLDNIHRLITGMKNSLDNVAHDLRTPMTRFWNMAEMALQSHGDAGSMREALEKGIEESDHILKMLDTIMDISEAEIGVMSIDRQMVDISVLVARVAEMYQFVAEEKGVELHLNIHEGLNMAVDSTRISQAVANILDNAIKFTPPGGHIHLETLQNNREGVIRIEDTGMGIRQEDLTRIWDRLFRCDQSRTEKGLGLGLSLVKGIVDAHNGRIKVASRPGKGSCFTILLPAFW